jgi:hypothetical protein
VRRLLELESLYIELLERIDALEDESSPFARAVEAAYERQTATRQPEQHPRPTPQPAIDAILYCVRERDPGALKEPANIERLHRCDAAARAEINRRIAALVKEARRG